MVMLLVLFPTYGLSSKGANGRSQYSESDLELRFTFDFKNDSEHWGFSSSFKEF